MNGREYLVPQENLPQLIDLAKTFDAEIYRVNVGNDIESILDISKLPQAICDLRFHLQADYTELGRVVPFNTATNAKTTHAYKSPPIFSGKRRKRTEFIKDTIRNKFLSNEIVSIDDLCDEYEDLSRTTLNNYVKSVRTNLANENITISRVGVGKYQVGPPSSWVPPTWAWLPPPDLPEQNVIIQNDLNL
jgi:hypothetical protein